MGGNRSSVKMRICHEKAPTSRSVGFNWHEFSVFDLLVHELAAPESDVTVRERLKGV